MKPQAGAEYTPCDVEQRTPAGLDSTEAVIRSFEFFYLAGGGHLRKSLTTVCVMELGHSDEVSSFLGQFSDGIGNPGSCAHVIPK